MFLWLGFVTPLSPSRGSELLASWKPKDVTEVEDRRNHLRAEQILKDSGHVLHDDETDALLCANAFEAVLLCSDERARPMAAEAFRIWYTSGARS